MLIMDKASFKAGDQIKIAVRDISDAKRTSIFEGTIMAIRGQGVNKTFTIRKIAVDKVAVERIFPLNSPYISNIKVVKQGDVRRAKLYYLRKGK